ncbi:MAG: HD domain-containing phosphohydrolase [Planctomycetota bacterium]
MRILLAEDDRTTRLFVSEALMSAGFRVTAVENGRQALEKYREQSFPMVVSDLDMPEMNGIELCRQVKQQIRDSYTYFIMLTAQTDASNVCSALEAGADDYVLKPYNEVELVLRAQIGERTVNLETRDMMGMAMSKLVEKRSNETCAHLRRIKELCLVLTHAARLVPDFADEIDEQFIQGLGETAWLHDIGKVAIPDSILLKPSALSQEERSIMETHTLHGADVFADALQRYPENRFLKMAYDIAISHHERWDGTGYPNKIPGDSIPLSGRIVAICDVYDALTSTRVYNDAMPHQCAVELILKSSGSHFDPRLVDVFLTCLSEFVEIKRRYPDERPEAYPSLQNAPVLAPV